MNSQLVEIHKTLFGELPEIKVISPSRINIIGEHIDYLGGNVFPANIDLNMVGFFSKSNNISMYSHNFKKDGVRFIADQNEFSYNKNNGFLNYVVGCLQILRDEGYKVGGFNASINSDIPASSGLSSSAFGVLIMKGITELYGVHLDGIEIAKLFKKVENRFMNLKNGIMDQFIIANGIKDHAMLLDTSTLNYENFKINLGEYKFVVLNTNKPRDLIDSKYNERVDETTKALKLINKKNSYENLCSIPMSQKESVLKLVKDPTLRKRAKYAIEEQERVRMFMKAIKDMDIKKMGMILNQGHAGLRDLYEVSCPESDLIQETANEVEGVAGARMTGAGFGGCLIALVKKDSIEEMKNKVIKKYAGKYGYKCEIYETEISDSTRLIK